MRRNALPPSSEALGRWVASALTVGAAGAIGVVAAGVLLSSASVTEIGLLLLALAPMIHVAAAAAAFARNREGRYAVAALTVLVLLLAGLVLAVLASPAGIS